MTENKTTCETCGMIIDRTPGYTHTIHDCIEVMKHQVKQMETVSFISAVIQILSSLCLREHNFHEIFTESNCSKLWKSFEKNNYDFTILWHKLNDQEKDQLSQYIATIL